MWIFLGVISVILLMIFYFKNQNAVWGGLMLGVIAGVVLAIIFNQNGFSWPVIIESAIIGTLLGFSAEILGKVGNLLRKQ